jgi:hypothetical protein
MLSMYSNGLCVLYIVRCSRQPIGLLLCRYYVCEYLRQSGKFNISYKQLKNGQDWWQKEGVTHKNITQTIANICGFI